MRNPSLTRRLAVWGSLLLCGAMPVLAAGASASSVDNDKPGKPPASAVTLVTLGTGGGPAERLKRAQSANALLVGDDIYLIDVADGVLRQLAAANLPLEHVRAVFITHHHIDHNGGLGSLLVRRWLWGKREKLPVIGPPMTVEMVQHLAAAYRPVQLAPITIGGPPAPAILDTVAPRDLPGDAQVPVSIFEDANVKVSGVLNDHYHYEPGSEFERESRSYALRFEVGGRSVVFTGDTGPSERVAGLAMNADMLVSEVIDLARIEKTLRSGGPAPIDIDALIRHLRQDHLTPPEVGKLAAKSRVRQVVLSHIVPGYDDETDSGPYMRGVTEIFKGTVSVARDLDRFTP